MVVGPGPAGGPAAGRGARRTTDRVENNPAGQSNRRAAQAGYEIDAADTILTEAFVIGDKEIHSSGSRAGELNRIRGFNGAVLADRGVGLRRHSIKVQGLPEDDAMSISLGHHRPW